MITEYHRPSTLDEAIGLAAAPDARILAGGTTSNADPDSGTAVVDIQGLGLGGISLDGDSVRVGAMTRLQDLVDSDLVPATLRELARREGPNTLRNAATIGGTIGASNAESGMLAGLVAFRATVTVTDSDSTWSMPVSDVLDRRDVLDSGIITEVKVPSGGVAAAARTARTPMDMPIVSAVAHKSHEGEVTLAMTGVAEIPIIVDPDRLDSLTPPSDFRGSSTYRAEIAGVLAGRVLASIGGGE